MCPPPELIEAPLTPDELGARYRALCDDPLYANVPGKIELDVWGRIVMSPPSNYDSMVQGRLSAPELCIEVVSPSNSVKEMQEKIAAYLAAGAHEVWIAYPESKRFEFNGPKGLLQASAYAVDLSNLFT